MNRLSKKLLSCPNHGKVHGFRSKSISVCQVEGLRFAFLVPEKWRQEESHKFEVSVVYIARHSFKQNRKPGELRNMAFSQACNKNTWRKQLQGGKIVLIHILGRDVTVASCAPGSREGMLVLDSLYFIFTPDLKAVEWCHSPHNSCESFCFSYP